MHRKLNMGIVCGGKDAFFGAVHSMAANPDGHIQSVCGAFNSLIGYKGNTQNPWIGVPDDILKQYNIAYTEKELKECVSFDKPI